ATRSLEYTSYRRCQEASSFPSYATVALRKIRRYQKSTENAAQGAVSATRPRDSSRLENGSALSEFIRDGSPGSLRSLIEDTKSSCPKTRSWLGA
ncbi:hypothetical protein TSAR_003238, partial [Trichomalopsis sarcophagae]